MTGEPPRALARAKINLFLHVTGRRDDGYHELDSLVAFADCGDFLEAEPGPGLSLSLDGPFGADLGAGADNLVIAAATALARHAGGSADRGAALRLVKNLPVASGLGGGSADAAAALRVLRMMWRLPFSEAELETIARSLGADVPVCVRSRSVRMRGIGHDLTPAPELPETWAVLVNPMVRISTAEVFAGLTVPELLKASGPETLPQWTDARTLADWLSRETRNDLQQSVTRFAPVITSVCEKLTQNGALMARMSGSGATCFGLFEAYDDAVAAAEDIRSRRPGWWIQPCGLIG